MSATREPPVVDPETVTANQMCSFNCISSSSESESPSENASIENATDTTHQKQMKEEEHKIDKKEEEQKKTDKEEEAQQKTDNEHETN